MPMLGSVVQTICDEDVCPVRPCVVMKHHSGELMMISLTPRPTLPRTQA